MANYLARVELHKATYDDYETLHAAMKERGFSRTIASDVGKRYQLPTGTYVVEGTSATRDQAYNAATAAASSTGKSFWAIVVDWSAGTFALEQVSSGARGQSA